MQAVQFIQLSLQIILHYVFEFRLHKLVWLVMNLFSNKENTKIKTITIDFAFNKYFFSKLVLR